MSLTIQPTMQWWQSLHIKHMINGIIIAYTLWHSPEGQQKTTHFSTQYIKNAGKFMK